MTARLQLLLLTLSFLLGNIEAFLHHTTTSGFQSCLSCRRTYHYLQRSSTQRRAIVGTHQDREDHGDDNDGIKRIRATTTPFGTSPLSSRRHFLWMEGLLSATLLHGLNTDGGWSLTRRPPAAHARGLVQFPFRKGFQLMNTYHIMRAGESLLEEDNILYTNPLFLTNRDCALSGKGTEQVRMTARHLMNDQSQSLPSIIMYSLAAHGMDTANVVKEELGIGQSRLLPEYTFLDPRGVGRWDSLPLEETEEAIWALDERESGNDGKSNLDKPPPNDDGTPNESLDNQVTRLWQLLNGLESRYSGETIMLIFPDGTGPALLSLCMAGIPYNRVHELHFEPGQIQLNVTQYTANEMLQSRTAEQISLYDEKINRGREELKRLQSLNDNDIVNVRDKQLIDTQREIAKETEERQKKQKKKEEDAKLARFMELQQTTQAKTSLDTTGTGTTTTIGVVPATASAGVAGLAIAGVAAATSSTTDPNYSVGQKGSGSVDKKDDRISVGASTNEDSLSKSLSPTSVANIVNGTMLARDDDDMLTVQHRFELDDQESIFEFQEKKEEMPVLDPEERARLAMEEYLNQDDGGDAWLHFLEDEIATTMDDEEVQSTLQQQTLEEEIWSTIGNNQPQKQQQTTKELSTAHSKAGRGRNETMYDESSYDASP